MPHYLPPLLTMSPALAALLQVILIDITLAGDNAVVLGMVAAHVPREVRPKVMFWGLAVAVVLRIILAMLAATLLKVIGLMFAGGILLLWVSWRLYRDVRQAHQHDGAFAGPRCPAQSGRQEHLGKHCLLLREVQRQERRPHAGSGAHPAARGARTSRC